MLMLATSCHKPFLSVSRHNIVILFDNDVHCAIDGYPVMAGLKDSMLAHTPYVALTSSGDFLSGGVYGSVSYGQFIVRLMNACGYDVVTLGNHEFDFQMPRLQQNMERLDAEKACCNFISTEDGQPVFKPYTLARFGKKKIAFVGAATPESLNSSSPTYFQDSEGRYVYDFYSGTQMIDAVQKAVNAARDEGADNVVLLVHWGEDETPALAQALEGVDVILDGHSHSVIPGTRLTAADGRDILWCSTGTAFEHIGCLTIAPDGTIESRLLKTADLGARDQAVADTVAAIKSEWARLGDRKVGESQVDLIAKASNIRYARLQETGIGNFCADAYRFVLGAEIGLAGGGSMRTNIMKGEVTFNHLYSVFPFNNQVSVGTVTGLDLLNALEMGARECPAENGGFLSVAGLIYEIDTSVVSTVEVDDHGVFVRVAGERRVKNVRIDSPDGTCELIDPERRYSVASCDYLLKQGGDGIVFPTFESERDGVCSDLEVLERYLAEHLGGVIGKSYQYPQGRIRIR